MPQLTKQFRLDVTVQQFIDACDDVELQELQLLLDKKLRQKQINDWDNSPSYGKRKTLQEFADEGTPEERGLLLTESG